MRELATPTYTKHKTSVEIVCLRPLECPSTFKCRDIKFLSLRVCVWPLSDPQLIDFLKLAVRWAKTAWFARRTGTLGENNIIHWAICASLDEWLKSNGHAALYLILYWNFLLDLSFSSSKTPYFLIIFNSSLTWTWVTNFVDNWWCW